MSEFDQSNLDLTTETPSGPVECLGQTFESDDARREHYTELLREKLKDPEFRKIEGFPIGEDEDILALSDPPYYTACPNPWIEDFIKHYGRPYDPDEKYHREPFAADVSEGRSGLFYDAHSYHTKVPHRAIMRYILHYTEPGDVLFDGFCGTGMTGVAAQLCADENEVRELGYRVDQEGTIFNEEGTPFSKLGARKAILSDLSPAATFISYNLNTPVGEIEKQARAFLSKTYSEYKWMYETIHDKGERKGLINYVIWSDLFVCSSCTNEIVFWDLGVDHEKGKINDLITCNNCGAKHTKKSLDRVLTSKYCNKEKRVFEQAKRKPVLINYFFGGKRYEKIPDSNDLNTLEKIENLEIDTDLLLNEIPDGFNTRQPKRSHGFRIFRDFYTKRNFLSLLFLKTNLSKGRIGNAIRFLINSYDVSHSTKMSRIIFKGGSKKPVLTGYQTGTLYVPSLSVEKNVFEGIIRQKLSIVFRSLNSIKENQLVSTGSAIITKMKAESLDYVFLDPPFGSNIMYSDLNLITESWNSVFTNQKSEAIENQTQGKTLGDYRKLMELSFREVYRILKKGRWLTVEFSNTKASVWNSIQSALTASGFIVANVAALDKQQGSFKAVTTTTAVKQDLVISAYKPSEQLELIFSENGDSVEGVWQFIDSHLNQLPVSKPKGGSLEFVAERDPRILYDRMVAFYFGHGVNVPLSSGEFQAALDDKYPDRDGMVFLPEQVVEYDKLAAKMESVGQMVVFVEDEKSAIGWLRQYLKDKPSTYQGVHPDFTQQLSASWRKFETRPELSVLLDQNFLKYSGEGDVPSQIHGYLSTDYHDLRNLEKNDPKLQAKAKDRWYVPDPTKMADVEAQREKKLLAEFWEYAAQAGVVRGQSQTSQTNLPLGESAKKKTKVKKLKEVRTDAVRAGFMECQRNNQGAVILAVAEILPANVIEEDEQLTLICDMAEMRAG
jgi:hypothetical protein